MEENAQNQRRVFLQKNFLYPSKVGKSRKKYNMSNRCLSLIQYILTNNYSMYKIMANKVIKIRTTKKE